jgi:hypothetical protein
LTITYVGVDKVRAVMGKLLDIDHSIIVKHSAFHGSSGRLGCAKRREIRRHLCASVPADFVARHSLFYSRKERLAPEKPWVRHPKYLPASHTCRGLQRMALVQLKTRKAVL